MARLVRDSLQERGFNVFMDVEDLKSGQFNEALLLEIEKATDVVVILSARSLERCSVEGDWLRWELRHAIECEKNVVPVAMRGFAWPAQSLPEELKKLPYYQGVEPSHALFGASIDKLVALLVARPMPRLFRRGGLAFAAAFGLGLAAILFVWLGPRGGGQQIAKSRPLPEQPDRDGWISLFDRNTLSGWNAANADQWQTRDGVLIGTGMGMGMGMGMRKVGDSHLTSPGQYTNLEFKSEVKLSHGGMAQMCFRFGLNAKLPGGYLAQLQNTGRGWRRTGSLLGFQSVPDQLVADDAWFTLHMIAISNHIIIKLNHRIVTDCIDPAHSYESGHLALHLNPNLETVVMFRNMMVKRLPADATEALVIARRDVPDIAVSASHCWNDDTLEALVSVMSQIVPMTPASFGSRGGIIKARPNGSSMIS